MGDYSLDDELAAQQTMSWNALLSSICGAERTAEKSMFGRERPDHFTLQECRRPSSLEAAVRGFPIEYGIQAER
jgi:hypothetical protein